MKKTKYLIVGGGMTADSAVRGIRSIDPSSSITMVSNEKDPPYNRPPLSKGLWQGKSIDKIWRRTEKQNIDLLINSTATRLDLQAKTIDTNNGETIGFEKILLATGASPRKFPYGSAFINYFRTLEDYQNLRSLSDEKDEFVIVGGGFIGSELAASLSLLAKKVRIVFPETWMNQRIFTPEICAHLHAKFKEHDVEVIPGISILSIEEENSRKVVRLKNTDGSTSDLSADGVIAGLGVLPNTSLAQEAGLEVDNGIRVNQGFQTAHPDVFSAGDVANFPDSYLNKNRRVEHEDHANATGMLAGKNMAGAGQSYDYLPYFYSDLFDIGYEAVGELDSTLEVTIDWVEPFKKGVFYYQRDGMIVGALLWNHWGKLDTARNLILERRVIAKSELAGLIQ